MLAVILIFLGDFPVQVLYSTPTNRRVVQPVTWGVRTIPAVIQLLFKLGGESILEPVSESFQRDT